MNQEIADFLKAEQMWLLNEAHDINHLVSNNKIVGIQERISAYKAVEELYNSYHYLEWLISKLNVKP